MEPLKTDAAKLRVTDLPDDREIHFDFRPDADARADLARTLGLLALRKLRFSGRITPKGKSDWQLTGQFGATVVQPCVVTLAPVTTRLEEPVMRTFLSDAPPPPPGGEMEMPDDDTAEPLSDTIALDRVMAEALALALPAYPRADDAEMNAGQFSEPRSDPMSDTDAHPFAGLDKLRDKLGKPPESD